MQETYLTGIVVLAMMLGEFAGHLSIRVIRVFSPWLSSDEVTATTDFLWFSLIPETIIHNMKYFHVNYSE